jgi:hypothetical protein
MWLHIKKKWANGYLQTHQSKKHNIQSWSNTLTRIALELMATIWDDRNNHIIAIFFKENIWNKKLQPLM